MVRGTTRSEDGLGPIARDGAEGVLADPEQIGSVLDHVADVTLIFWLLGSAEGPAETVAGLHGDRLERFLVELVDTPVRGFVYEAAGSVEPAALAAGSRIARAAAERWRIPVEVVDAEPELHERWRDAMLVAAERLVGA
jgi:hypothetical protein